MTFYKSKKLGAFKIGFSTKGIGVSTGVKGLRLGISSSGTPYVSGGIGGFRYRKNLTTSRTRYKKQPKVKLINNYDKNLKEEIEYTNPHNKNEEVKNKYTFEIPQKISKRKRNYLILFFVCLFLSSIKNIFWIPCFLFLFLFIRIKFKLSKCN